MAEGASFPLTAATTTPARPTLQLKLCESDKVTPLKNLCVELAAVMQRRKTYSGSQLQLSNHADRASSDVA